jgi:hypothetical protein
MPGMLPRSPQPQLGSSLSGACVGVGEPVGGHVGAGVGSMSWVVVAVGVGVGAPVGGNVGAGVGSMSCVVVAGVGATVGCGAGVGAEASHEIAAKAPKPQKRQHLLPSAMHPAPPSKHSVVNNVV